MKNIETIIKKLKPYIEDKTVLEVACGDSDFSIGASQYASKVLGTDISLERVSKRNIETLPPNLTFMKMDAIALDIPDEIYDVTACYNALGHLEDIFIPVLKEMCRVTVKNGHIILIATWKMDRELFAKVRKAIKEDNDMVIEDEFISKAYEYIVIKKL